jgi:hypothetical protein
MTASTRSSQTAHDSAAAPEPIRNPPAYVAVGLSAVAALALVTLFKIDWNLSVSFLTAAAAAALATVAAVVAVAWSVAKRGRGWLAAVVALLVSLAALGWVGWTVVILIRAAA